MSILTGTYFYSKLNSKKIFFKKKKRTLNFFFNLNFELDGFYCLLFFVFLGINTIAASV